MELHKLLKKGDIIHKTVTWIQINWKTGIPNKGITTNIFKVTKIVYRSNYKHDIYLTKQIKSEQKPYQILVSNKEINRDYILPLSSTLKKL